MTFTLTESDLQKVKFHILVGRIYTTNKLVILLRVVTTDGSQMENGMTWFQEILWPTELRDKIENNELVIGGPFSSMEVDYTYGDTAA